MTLLFGDAGSLDEADGRRAARKRWSDWLIAAPADWGDAARAAVMSQAAVGDGDDDAVYLAAARQLGCPAMALRVVAANSWVRPPVPPSLPVVLCRAERVARWAERLMRAHGVTRAAARMGVSRESLRHACRVCDAPWGGDLRMAMEPAPALADRVAADADLQRRANEAARERGIAGVCDVIGCSPSSVRLLDSQGLIHLPRQRDTLRQDLLAVRDGRGTAEQGARAGRVAAVVEAAPTIAEAARRLDVAYPVLHGCVRQGLVPGVPHDYRSGARGRLAAAAADDGDDEAPAP